jgi:hypothetical protein
MIPKPKKHKKTERQRAEEHADYWLSKYVRRRDGRCVICGEPDPAVLQAGHLIRRGKRGTRWSTINVNCQCKSCNFKHNHYPEIYTEWFIRQYGMEAYGRLIELSRVTKIPTLDIKKMGDTFKAHYFTIGGE